MRDGAWVKISSRAGETTIRAQVTERVAPGVVYTTFHYQSSGTNIVTTENSDWATNCPEYKVTAVQVMPAAERAACDEQARARCAAPRRSRQYRGRVAMDIHHLVTMANQIADFFDRIPIAARPWPRPRSICEASGIRGCAAKLSNTSTRAEGADLKEPVRAAILERLRRPEGSGCGRRGAWRRLTIRLPPFVRWRFGRLSTGADRKGSHPDTHAGQLDQNPRREVATDDGIATS